MDVARNMLWRGKVIICATVRSYVLSKINRILMLPTGIPTFWYRIIPFCSLGFKYMKTSVLN